jgi:hypothetical protein
MSRLYDKVVWMSVIAGFGLNISCSRSQPKDTKPETQKHDPKVEVIDDRESLSGAEGNLSDSVKDELLKNLKVEWADADRNLKGDKLISSQWALEKRLISVGPGLHLVSFFDFLSTRGANDTRERVISEVGNALFSGPDANKAFVWLVTVPDKDLRTKLCRSAGKHHPADGLKEFIGSFDSDANCQSEILTGYCKNLARTDPSGAVKTFMDMRPPKVTFGGLVEVMSVLPSNSNFSAISSTLPDDSKNIAKRARSALLRSWANANAGDAAQYVMANTTLASSEQMSVVVEEWCKKSPSDAATWIDALNPGEFKDQGIIALARFWLPNEPARAWGFVTKIGQHNLQVETATNVFKEWEKIDRPAATAAWLKQFPNGK